MKTIPPTLRPWLLIFALVLLLAVSAALSPASPLQQGVLPAAALAAPTPKPQLPVDEVSTDLIVLLGGALLLIILTPILLHVREWARRGRDDGRAGVDGDEE